MNRREFLQPKRLANLAAPVLGVVDELETPVSSSDPVLLRFARQAMATTFEVVLPFDTPSAGDIAQAALDEIDRLEAQLTVYRDTSEVSRLNAKAAFHPVHVEKNLFDLLVLADKLQRETEGAFDISVGALIKTWGFHRREGRVPTPEERAAVRERIGMQHIRLDADRQTVFFQRQGIEINLGSIGKGFAIDCAAQLLLPSSHRGRGAGGEGGAPASFLIHGGHSSILARGNESPTSRGWTIGITDPERPQCRRALLHLCNRAMATSAVTYQHIEHEGKKLGHLLDPRTAWPADGILSATVTAPTAAEADALATAFFILGVEKARAYCVSHPDIGAALIAADAPQQVFVMGRATDEVEILR
ncbi:MAG: FAD:protein FMN transferase [Gemmataceae bacterium]|nr:FAD:protein FMN transferase [Gemmataceae bacterium]